MSHCILHVVDIGASLATKLNMFGATVARSRFETKMHFRVFSGLNRGILGKANLGFALARLWNFRKLADFVWIDDTIIEFQLQSIAASFVSSEWTYRS
jgi:hypothetical protein